MSNEPLPSSFDGDTNFYEESVWQKLSRNIKEEPLVPLGCALTCAALLGAFRSSYRGDPTTMNRMLRGRIYAQGFTLIALVVGSVYYETDRTKRKQFDGLVKERKHREKNEAWIRELEFRDEEDKLMKERRRKMMEQATMDDEGKASGDGSRRGGVLEAVKELKREK